MDRANHLRLVEQLQAELAAPPSPHPAFTIPADRYRDPARAARERAVFAATPRVLAASASVAVGACVPVDVPGAAVILTRDADGSVRGLTNACRHRATRLVDAPCTPKALVCPYHGWTYDLRGTLIHAPHADTFTGACAHRDLRPVAVAERHGLIWLGADLDAYLGTIAIDLAALALDRAVAWRSSRVIRKFNWKLALEAFLDGYHIRVLHRDSIYRFFLDAASVAEPVGRHIRAVTGRRPLREAPAAIAGVDDLRTLGTPSYVLFPGTVVVEHPDFVSVLTITPVGPDASQYEHLMLVPAARANETEHWNRSWTLIEDGVFQGEDLWACEQIQRSIDAGATDELLFGSLEVAIGWFHASLDAALVDSRR